MRKKEKIYLYPDENDNCILDFTYDDETAQNLADAYNYIIFAQHVNTTGREFWSPKDFKPQQVKVNLKHALTLYRIKGYSVEVIRNVKKKK